MPKTTTCNINFVQTISQTKDFSHNGHDHRWDDDNMLFVVVCIENITKIYNMFILLSEIFEFIVL